MKRKAIGELFVRIFEENTGGLTEAEFLVQGTLYPDLIESGGADGTADVIKSHHNVGGLPDDMTLAARRAAPRPVQGRGPPRSASSSACPTRWCGASRSRARGSACGSSARSRPTRWRSCRRPTPIVREEIAAAGLEREIWQAFAVLLDIRSVGVMGDERTYGHPIVIRAVTSDDAMTADWARLPYDVLERMSSRIINEVPGINRVAYDITSKPPGTIEWE